MQSAKTKQSFLVQADGDVVNPVRLPPKPCIRGPPSNRNVEKSVKRGERGREVRALSPASKLC